MFILTFLAQHYTMIIELIGLLVMLGISVHINPRGKRMTRAVIILLLVVAAMYETEQWTQTLSTLSLLRPMLTACIYSMYPVIMILTMQITTNQPLSGLRAWLLLIPEIVCVPLFFSSQWTRIVFWFTEDNGYQGGLFPWLPYVLFAFYSVVFIVQNWFYLRNDSTRNRFIASFLMIGPLLGVLLYLATDYSSDYSALFTSALILYYLFIYIHMARMDALTGLTNRQSYYQDMITYRERITAAVSADMNDLKYFNDTFGHSAGDTALKTISGILIGHRGKNGTVYRVGGDEFVILYRNADEEYVTSHIAEMREEMSKTPYACAFGYSMKIGGSDVEAVVRVADAEMYKDKASMKKLSRNGEH